MSASVPPVAAAAVVALILMRQAARDVAVQQLTEQAIAELAAEIEGLLEK